MDKNNQDSLNNSRDLHIPDRNQARSASASQAQQQAAINIARGQVERIYQGGSDQNTPHTTPVVQQPNILQTAQAQSSPQAQATQTAEQNKQFQPQILTKSQKTIQPIQGQSTPAANTPEAHQRLGAVDYKPNPQATRETRIQTNDYGDQWKRYHAAWQNYYQKYYESYYTAAVRTNLEKHKSQTPKATETPLSEEDKKAQALHALRRNITNQAKEKTHKFRKSRHFVPIISAVAVVAIFLFLQYNRFLVAGVYAYVSPGNATPQETIYSPTASVEVSPDPKLIIPKINVDVPVVYGVGNDQKSQLDAMNQGVAHFAIPGANSVPGQVGNTVLSGHSSNDLFDSGNYKFIFAQLDRLGKDDIIYANYESKRYAYKVTETKIVLPTDVQSLVYPSDKPILTLITCTPLGTAEKRLLVIAEQISPDPAKAKPQEEKGDDQTENVEMPSTAPTFFEKLFSWDWN